MTEAVKKDIQLPTTEVGWMRLVACVAIIVLTMALASLNIAGAWIGSGGNLQFTMTIFGAELLAAVCLVLILAAPTWPRKIVGAVVFTVLVWVCIENGKMSVERSFKDIFVGSAESLDQKAAVAQSAADTLKADAPADLRALKEEKAKLEIERDLMKSNDPKGIEQAQISLKSMGLYVLPIDGIRGPDTEAAMLSRGAKIAARLAELDKMITPEGGTSAAEDKANAAIDLADQANKVRGGAVWMNMLLIGLEGARSFGLWCFVIWSTGQRKVQVSADAYAELQRKADELDERLKRQQRGREKAKATTEEKKNTQDASFEPLKIEDQRAEAVQREEVAATPPEPDAPTEEEVQAEETETPAEEPAEETVNDNADSDESEPGAEESDDDGRRSAA